MEWFCQRGHKQYIATTEKGCSSGRCNLQPQLETDNHPSHLHPCSISSDRASSSWPTLLLLGMSYPNPCCFSKPAQFTTCYLGGGSKVCSQALTCWHSNNKVTTMQSSHVTPNHFLFLSGKCCWTELPSSCLKMGQKSSTY